MKLLLTFSGMCVFVRFRALLHSAPDLETKSRIGSADLFGGGVLLSASSRLCEMQICWMETGSLPRGRVA